MNLANTVPEILKSSHEIIFSKTRMIQISPRQDLNKKISNTKV